eukprot:15465406-Alexandrium_andersonii.AAC.1
MQTTASGVRPLSLALWGPSRGTERSKPSLPMPGLCWVWARRGHWGQARCRVTSVPAQGGRRASERRWASARQAPGLGRANSDGR